MRGGVAFFASERGVFALEFVARLAVVELFFRRFPVNEREVFAVVFQVTAHAVLAVRILHLYLVMVTVLGDDIVGDFLVAFQALEGGSARAELMAGVALRSAV